jgi:hypothetical protein
MPKQTIFLETPVFLFSLLRIFDRIFDVLIEDPYLTQYNDSAIENKVAPKVHCGQNFSILGQIL